jgi:hypothetical protein
LGSILKLKVSQFASDLIHVQILTEHQVAAYFNVKLSQFFLKKKPKTKSIYEEGIRFPGFFQKNRI